MAMDEADTYKGDGDSKYMVKLAEKELEQAQGRICLS